MGKIQNTGRFVRRKTGLPFIGMVYREDKDIFGNPIFIVAQYGYSTKEIGWPKSDCEELPSVPVWIDIEGWLRLANSR